LLAIGPTFFAFKEFVASTSPASMPFSLPGAKSISLARLPNDHVMMCYIDGGGIHYRESDTRGASWYEPRSVISTNLTDAGNLYAKVVQSGGSNVLLLAWDAEIPENATRRAFYATINLATGVAVNEPAFCSSGSGAAVEQYPTIAGGDGGVYHMAWLVNASGDHSIALRNGTSLSSWGPISAVGLGTDSITYPRVLVDSHGNPEVVYSRANATAQQLVHRSIQGGVSFSQPNVLINESSGGSTFTCFDSSLSSADDLVVSFHGSGTVGGESVENASVIVYATRASGFADVKQETFVSRPAVHCLGHITFTNDQVLTAWLETTEVLFTITDFDMSNKNSTFHSILLADIFISCGAFNVFVHFHLKKKKKLDENSEPLNNHAVTACFVAIGIIMLVPLSGFQGERMGESYADGFVFPAPINLATVIVVGFVFLFFGVTTPLIDKFWRRDKREQQSILNVDTRPFSWKQEILRKIPHVAVAFLIIGFDPLGSNAMQFVNVQKYDQFNFVNEGGIIFDYVLRLNNIEIGSYAVKIVMASGMVFLWILDLHVLLASPTTYYFAKDYFIIAFRKKERTSMADFVIMFSSLLLMILVLTFHPQYKLQGSFVCFAGFASLCFGDTAGMIAGRLFGKHKLWKGAIKSWEGAIAGAAVSFLSALVFVEWPFALLVAGTYVAVDIITARVPISDNFLIPVITALVFLPLLPFVSSPLAGLYA
ncbi:MAG: phosphatidate cytidylyltransferase, partial [Candidatus Lokiarchaeota archaeon]|nr:phosphatidate cytidylyltransferase [Candidatus Lokiarchaeota archaeon]